MPDLFDPLRSLTREPTAPLPAEEVRRRGDRLRRRRHALQSLGAACAVAAVVGGGLMVTGGDASRSGGPVGPATQAPSLTATWRTRVPESFPLSTGVPDAEPLQDPATVSWTGPTCQDDGGLAVVDVDPVDAGGAVRRTSSYDRTNQLLVFPDAAAARHGLRAVVEAFEVCDPATIEGRTWRFERVPLDLGGEESTVVRVTNGGATYDNADGVSVVGLVRTGNALLVGSLVHRTSSSAGDELALDLFPDLRTVAAQMCVFAAEPCADPADPRESAPVLAVPDGFPLDEGLSRGETVLGPARDTRFVAEIQVCDAAYSPADVATDRVTVTSSGPEYFQGRDLSVYADAETARRTALDLVDKIKACPRFTLDDGASYTVTEVTDNPAGDLGEESWTVMRGYESGGVPALGQEILQVVRVGNALLVTAVRGEGPGLTDRNAFVESAKEDRVSLVPVVSGMCVFSASRC